MNNNAHCVARAESALCPTLRILHALTDNLCYVPTSISAPEQMRLYAFVPIPIYPYLNTCVTIMFIPTNLYLYRCYTCI